MKVDNETIVLYNRYVYSNTANLILERSTKNIVNITIVQHLNFHYII